MGGFVFFISKNSMKVYRMRALQDSHPPDGSFVFWCMMDLDRSLEVIANWRIAQLREQARPDTEVFDLRIDEYEVDLCGSRILPLTQGVQEGLVVGVTPDDLEFQIARCDNDYSPRPDNNRHYTAWVDKHWPQYDFIVFRPLLVGNFINEFCVLRSGFARLEHLRTYAFGTLL